MQPYTTASIKQTLDIGNPGLIILFTEKAEPLTFQKWA